MGFDSNLTIVERNGAGKIYMQHAVCSLSLGDDCSVSLLSSASFVIEFLSFITEQSL